MLLIFVILLKSRLNERKFGSFGKLSITVSLLKERSSSLRLVRMSILSSDVKILKLKSSYLRVCAIFMNELFLVSISVSFWFVRSSSRTCVISYFIDYRITSSAVTSFIGCSCSLLIVLCDSKEATLSLPVSKPLSLFYLDPYLLCRISLNFRDASERETSMACKTLRSSFCFLSLSF